MKTLRERLADVPQVGKVTWIGVRPAAGEPMTELAEVEALEERGLRGDIRRHHLVSTAIEKLSPVMCPHRFPTAIGGDLPFATG